MSDPAASPTPPDEITDPRQRVAWEALAAGAARVEAAKRAGAHRSSVSSWIRKWRATYGDDLFRTVREEAAAAGLVAASLARDQRWTERKITIERKLSRCLDVAADRLIAQLNDADSPAKDAKDIATIVGILVDKTMVVAGDKSGRDHTPLSLQDVDRLVDGMVDTLEEFANSGGATN